MSRKVLMIDVGGTKVKLMVSGQAGRRCFRSGPRLRAQQMARKVVAMTRDWEYDAVSLGYPSLVLDGFPGREPINLGGGWMDFDYEDAFKCPVRFINDAAMQALASYQSGRMLFLGFGTSTGAAVIVDDVIIPLEIGMLRLSRKYRFMDCLTNAARKSEGTKKWLLHVYQAIAIMRDTFHPDDVVIGGGNAKKIDPLPRGCRKKDNQAAFIGAIRLWPGADMIAEPYGSSYRIRKTPAAKFPSAKPALLAKSAKGLPTKIVMGHSTRARRKKGPGSAK